MAEAPQAAPVAAPQAVPATVPTPVVEKPPDMPYGTRLYEVMWVVDANMARDGMNKVMDGLKEIVEKSGGKWINGDKYDERRLAYPVKKKKRGTYVISHLTAPTETLTRLERNIQISDLVLRALVTLDDDGLILTPPVRSIEDDEFGGGFGGGGFGGGERSFGRGPRSDREERGPRRGPPSR